MDILLPHEKPFLLSIHPHPSTQTYIAGLPGITPFTLHCLLHITNPSKSKHKAIHSLKCEFRGMTWANVGVFEAHIERKVVLVEPPVKGALEDSRVRPLGPGETREFEVVFEVEGGGRGGPEYLPARGRKLVGRERANTAYSFDVILQMHNRSFLTSSTIPITATADVPLIWYDHQDVTNLFRIPTLDPAPGWTNSIPHHIPTTTPFLPDYPFSIDLTFPSGLTFSIGGYIDFNIRITPKPGRTLTLDSITLQIDQTTAIFASGATSISGGGGGGGEMYGVKPKAGLRGQTSTIFQTRIKSIPLTTQQFSLPLEGRPPVVGEEEEGAILPTRCKAGLDKSFIVKHVFRVLMKISGGVPGHVEVPCRVVEWKKADVMQYFKDNPDVKNEVIDGTVPEYVPEYVEP
ncbi:hypothetical protein HDV00_000585 [Rhizophlyctis rosea]|nr:hypothetical protein HDV00_000585 [Rhizophlyctis rosea]